MILSRKFYFRLTVLLLFVAAGNDAAAQFWKKEKPRKKVYPSNRYPAKAKEEVKKEEKKRKKRTIEYPASIKKERYRMDILIPLYLDELVKGGKPSPRSKWPDKAVSGINFYEGIKLAIDTLANMGYTTDIYIHDITSSSVQKLIKGDSLEESDLIIGFVSSMQVDDLAKYAKSKKVNFISAFSPSDANVKDNPYFILMNPTLQNNCEEIARSAIKKRNRESIVLYKRMSNATDSSAYSFITDNEKAKNIAEIECDKMPDSAALAALFDSTTTNIVIIPVIDAAYAEKLINQLDRLFPGYRFNVFGMPSWKGIVSNKKMIELGEHIAINITQPYYFDQTVSSGIDLANRYKAAFGGKPSELTYRGFELVYWMTDLLNKYGAIFNEKTEDNGMAVFTKFDLKPKWDAENNLYYIENKHLYLYHYQAGTVLVEQ